MRLNQIGLKPADLLDPQTERRLRPLYDEYLARAQAHLSAGWAYTNALPSGQVRGRLACAWPVLSFVNKFKDEFEAKGAPDEAKSSTARAPGARETPGLPAEASH